MREKAESLLAQRMRTVAPDERPQGGVRTRRLSDLSGSWAKRAAAPRARRLPGKAMTP